MKPEEAIERLEYLESALDGYPPETGINDVFAAIDTAINALKEVQQYREIGTVEECRKAVEKQKPKPCEFYGDEEDGKLLCPNCGGDLWDLKECGFNNCPYCGQAINENLEGME